MDEDTRSGFFWIERNEESTPCNELLLAGKKCRIRGNEPFFGNGIPEEGNV